MAAQYLELPDGTLDHKAMAARERALSVLFAYGLVTGTARGEKWTEAGKAFLDAG